MVLYICSVHLLDLKMSGNHLVSTGNYPSSYILDSHEETARFAISFNKNCLEIELKDHLYFTSKLCDTSYSTVIICYKLRRKKKDKKINSSQVVIFFTKG